ncbi:MAG: DNA cytosine methyltransferase [Streptosporangiales bacterium]|nr:DNA cytosine methyltransferase [Streptosporangiales bacterium]
MTRPSAPEAVIDMFAGPGGWDLAARQLGLPDPAGFELDPSACRTRAAAGLVTVRADVAAFPVRQLRGRVRAVVGSPVCITFSEAGSRAGLMVTDMLAGGIRDQFAGCDTRPGRRADMAGLLDEAGFAARHANSGTRPGRIRAAAASAALVLEPARWIAAAHPEWIALEQVPSVLPLWRVYAEELRRAGYETWCGVLNAADFGVPQARRRAILIASRVRRVSCPPPTHYDPRSGTALFGEPWMTMAAAIGFGAKAVPAPSVTAGGTGSGGAEIFGNRSRQMLARHRDSGNWVKRAEGDPESVRVTVREAAALQSFPPGWPWRGTKTRQSEQVGNAWCPLAAVHVLGMAAGIEPAGAARRLRKAVYGSGRAAA